MTPCLVVSGLPCSGKSTLAEALARRTGWPLLAKDAYKEAIFDRLGWSDREWSRRASALAWQLLIAEAGRLLGAGVACILEGNFRGAQFGALEPLGRPNKVRFVEIRCGASAEVLAARYAARARAGARHPGHVDEEARAELEVEFRGPPAQRFAAETVTWDTTGGFDVAAPWDALAALDPPLFPHRGASLR